MKLKEEMGYDKNSELIRRYREGDKEAGEEIVLLNTPLVYKLAGKLVGRGVELSELVELGMLGLMKAVRTFDFSRECAFSTYAVHLIFGEMRRFLRDDGMIKVSRESKRLAAMLNAEKERRLNTGGDIGITSIASAVGVCPADAAAALFAATPPRSLDEVLFDGEGKETLGAFIADEDAEERSFDKIAVRMAIDTLTPIEEQIINLRYFRDLSQAQTARILGMTQVKISRLEKKILATLRERLS